jgi:hypothetical protein
LVIHGGDLRHRWMAVVGHDRRSWRYDCSILIFRQLVAWLALLAGVHARGMPRSWCGVMESRCYLARSGDYACRGRIGRCSKRADRLDQRISLLRGALSNTIVSPSMVTEIRRVVACRASQSQAVSITVVITPPAAVKVISKAPRRDGSTLLAPSGVSCGSIVLVDPTQDRNRHSFANANATSLANC